MVICIKNEAQYYYVKGSYIDKVGNIIYNEVFKEIANDDRFLSMTIDELRQYIIKEHFNGRGIIDYLRIVR